MNRIDQYTFCSPVSWLLPHIDTLLTRGMRRRGARFLAGYLLCVIGLFVGCIIAAGWYTALMIFGTIHIGSALVLFVCQGIAVRRTQKRASHKSIRDN